MVSDCVSPVIKKSMDILRNENSISGKCDIVVASAGRGLAGYNQENFGKSIAQYGKVLEPQTIADSIHWLTLPPHVNINEIMVRPTGQSFP